MLQQTTVAAVGPYFKKFITRWPSMKKLAAAPLDEVLAAWAGLGYYSRARNLHACAAKVVAEYNGQLPTCEDELRRLPGIGRYTAAAISAIAFAQPANVVDGNVERVMARLFAVTTPLPAAKAKLYELAGQLVPKKRAGDYAQALMDLGATLCMPKNPQCARCPLQKKCAAYAAGLAAALPRRLAKPAVPLHKTTAYVVQAGNAVLLRRREAKGLLGGMLEVPHDGLRTSTPARLPLKVKKWQTLAQPVQHVFSHFHVQLSVQQAKINKPSAALPPPYFWASIKTLEEQALPSIMQKVLRAAGLFGGN